MLKKTKRINSKLKFLKFFLIPSILVYAPFFNNIPNSKAGLEFQWEQNSGYRRLNWFQKENTRGFRNKIYFFLRPIDRKTDLLKIDIAIPKTFKTGLKTKNISICKVKIGGFQTRTKCVEEVPADIEITNDESSLRRLIIYPYSPIPSSKDSYAIVLKLFNPKKSGLFQFHSYGQLKGKSISNYLGSWTIVID